MPQSIGLKIMLMQVIETFKRVPCDCDYNILIAYWSAYLADQ